MSEPFQFRDARGVRASINRSKPEALTVPERPILFSGAMVRALLDGRKTQTRHVVKGVPSGDHYGRDIMDWGLSGIHQGDFGEMERTDRWFLDVQTDVDDNSRREIKCPYGAPGNRLWVREAFACISDCRHDDPGTAALAAGAFYRADERVDCGDIRRWRPSIHMPRWVSRITLEITGVRVERLQAISQDDAKAEGVCPCDDGTWSRSEDRIVRYPSPAMAFCDLWCEINGRESWNANPFVWVVEFRRVQP